MALTTKSHIAVSLTRKQDLAKALASGADYLELRNDYFTAQELEILVEKSTLPVIYTVKKPSAFNPSLYKHIRYIDGGKYATIKSFHDYKGTPSFERLDTLVKAILKNKQLPKIATYLRNVNDLYVLARLQQKFGKRIIAVGMGELGKITRVYNKSLLTFASISKTGTAPGQLTVQETKNARIYGLIGSDIQHSLSPQLHSTYDYHYQLWQTDDIKKMMFVFEWFGLPGASVTMPYKQTVMDYCNTLDVHAKKIGAVNTLVRKGKKLVGHNTDWIGIQQAIGKYMQGKRVMILGTGGVAKAAEYAAKQSGAAHVSMLGRTSLPTTETDWDVVINATPVNDALLVSADSLTGKVVMDCIYGKQTKLLAMAKQKKAKIVLDGLPMLQAQAKEQAQFWQNTQD